MLATSSTPYLGHFREADYGNRFEFFKAETNAFGMPHLIDVDNGQIRFGRVLKTVAYIVIDGEDGEPVLERWNIRQL
jgi:hypothetical protein